MKNTTLHLLNFEMAKWNAFPEEKKEGWTVQLETNTSFETADVLKVRANMARFETFPVLRDVVKKAASGQKIDLATLRGMPEAVLPELCFTIGAVGMTSLIAALFTVAVTNEDIAAIAGFTSIRHDILSTNASVAVPRR